MSILSKIQALINQLNQELNQTEQDATSGLNRVRQALFSFPDNASLIQFFAYLNEVLLFVENSREEIQIIIESISATVYRAW